MGGLEEHIRQLNNYNTIFGTFWFNILCVSLNIAQIITSVVLLGYFHTLITIDYIWWPAIETIRLCILTLLRFDVMLKGVENYSDNRSGFKYTKRMIIICNLIGFFFILIGAPIYLALLSTPTNSLYERANCYTIFMSVYPIFIAVRIFLTIPMYCTLLIGTNPIWEINQGYQRIDDALATRHRQTQRRVRRAQDGYQYDDTNEARPETNEERAQRQMRRQWRIMELERRQMQLAIEESRRDAFRNTRKEQDDEYERALREAKEARERAERERDAEQAANGNNDDNNAFSAPPQIQEENMLFGSNANANSSFLSSGTDGVDADGDDMGMGSGGDAMDDSMNDMYNIENKMELDALPPEAEESEECVCVRIRLPNGIRCQRRFHFSASMEEVMLWTYHECMKHRQTHLVNHCQLVSTHPRTVYDEMEKNLKELKFWRPNAKRMLASHLLFVEEL
eukprot:CAMPEP_0197021306 /NCGR_PEP_ID=MMETSP1384-20130603/2181_1 /TAXON_ID=29189 /ORGANISM="Ammonia sp." /LENGTH=452 /DNA_ID=CAMNT_0042449099 /DNA_START=85 /DNA_END=1443 /DNA_ORIENTATION=-